MDAQAWLRRSIRPVLQPLETIECRDAVLTKDGKVAEWPVADVIIGNPPFLGDKPMISVMGVEYTGALRHAFAGRILGGADLVTYWFEKARQAIEKRQATRAGLVGMQAIRKGASRRVIDAIVSTATIFEAWSDEAWTVEGAAVRVSLLCFGSERSFDEIRLNGKQVTNIHADLTSGASDITQAALLDEDKGISFVGTQKNGDFDVDGDTARTWLTQPLNPNGRPNSDVVKPWRNASQIVGREADVWIIDFGVAMGEADASLYAAPFAHVVTKVRPLRQTLRRQGYRHYWWRHAEPRPGLRRVLANLDRYIATPRVAKHRIFVWLPSCVIPDTRLVVIAKDDATTFGILQCHIHEIWALAQAPRHGVGNDPTYNNDECFETFPFPSGLTPNLPAATYADNPHAQAIAAAARDLVEKRDLWLSPPDLVERVPEVVPGFPDRIIPRSPKAATILKARTLTNLDNMRGTPEGTWLDNLHRALDEAVAAAYGWPADLSDDEILSRLLDLNRARAGGEDGQGTRGVRESVGARSPA